MVYDSPGSHDCPGTGIYSWSFARQLRDTAIPSSFDHLSAAVLRHGPEAGYKTSFSCTAVMDMPVSLAGVTDESQRVLIPQEESDLLPSSGFCLLLLSQETLGSSGPLTQNEWPGPDQRKDVKISF